MVPKDSERIQPTSSTMNHYTMQDTKSLIHRPACRNKRLQYSEHNERILVP